MLSCFSSINSYFDFWLFLGYVRLGQVRLGKVRNFFSQKQAFLSVERSHFWIVEESQVERNTCSHFNLLRNF
jgi:hypothetical protein